MKSDTLDEFSKSFAERLLATYPEWLLFAKACRSAGGDHDHLVVEVPPPEGADAASPLRIDTANGEVTVEFDYYHTHFDWPPDTLPLALRAADPMAFIAAILSEEVAVASGWEGGVWLGSWLVEEQANLALDGALGRVTHIRVRSWRGAWNIDFDVPS